MCSHLSTAHNLLFNKGPETQHLFPPLDVASLARFSRARFTSSTRPFPEEDTASGDGERDGSDGKEHSSSEGDALHDDGDNDNDEDAHALPTHSLFQLLEGEEEHELYADEEL